MTVNHQSDSSVQRGAEGAIVDALGALLGVALNPGGALKLSGGVSIQLDARSADGQIAVEAYARQGRLKGAQLKKIAQDVLKLALLRTEPGLEEVRTIIVFASEEALRSVTGWVKRAAEVFGVELIVVEIDSKLREMILATQERQKMVNVALDEAVGDIAAEG